MSRPFDSNTKSGRRSAVSRLTTALLKPLPLVDPVSTRAPSDWTPNGLTAKTDACRPSSKVPSRIWTKSSAPILSRSARVACTAPWASKARIPKWMAVAEYQTSTSVESAAGTPSTGVNWENPVSSAAADQTASSRVPSTVTSASSRGGCTSRRPARPL